MLGTSFFVAEKHVFILRMENLQDVICHESGSVNENRWLVTHGTQYYQGLLDYIRKFH